MRRRRYAGRVIVALTLTGTIVMEAPAAAVDDDATAVSSPVLPLGAIEAAESTSRAPGTGTATASQIAAIAVIRNPRVRALRAGLGRSRAELVAAGLLPNPEAETRWLVTTDDGTVGGEVNLLFDLRDVLLLRGPRLDAAQLGLEEAKLRVVHEEWQVAMDAREALLTIAALESEWTLEQERAETFERMLEILKARHDAGDASRLDVVSLELEILEITRARIALEGDRKRAISHLGAVIGLGPEEPPPEVPGLAPGLSRPRQDRSPRGLDALVAALSETRADVLAAAAAVESAEQALAGARRGQVPAFRLGPSYERDGDEQAVGGIFELEIPLFDRNQAEIRSALAVARESQESLRATLQAAQRDLADAWGSREATERELAVLAGEVEPRILEMMDTTIDAFELGDLSTQEALQLQTRAIETRRTFLRRLRDARLGQLAIDRAVGPYWDTERQQDPRVR